MKDFTKLAQYVITDIQNSTVYHYNYNGTLKESYIMACDYNVTIEDFNVEEMEDDSIIATRYVFVKMAFIEFSYMEKVVITDDYMESYIEDDSMNMDINEYPF